ncbi:MAG TPA: heptaprenylglyceryl phosphate synthase [Virgibacillus sp.]|nr:heptaprenylglyceryl phosphate synthase [Virgibacillus sp.]
MTVNEVMKQWSHIFKLDPAKEITDETIERICTSGTDAIIVGGTDAVTLEGVLYLLRKLRKYRLPCILEISTMDAIVPGFDYYFIPMVMNSKEKKWMMDIQHQAIKEYRDFMDWDTIVMEGYCILNEDSKAFIKTNCLLPDVEDVTAYAYMAEHIFKLPVFYVEYSGTYGDPDLVRQAKEQVNHTLLFYGGGIESPNQAIEMKEHADVIIVGNSIYTDLENALCTVEAIKEMS